MLDKIDFGSMFYCIKFFSSFLFTGFSFYLIWLFGNAKFFATFIASVASIYFILQRFHLRLQVRFLKNISDEIIKINDFCIEFSYKHEQLIESFNLNELNGEEEEVVNQIKKIDADRKLIAELKTLRSKTKNHLDYLAAQITAFPYGNPLNFFWFSITGEYLKKEVPLTADALLTTYQDVILTDTILQIEISLYENVNDVEKPVAIIDIEKIDDIVVAGLDIITLLEDHSKKFI